MACREMPSASKRQYRGINVFILASQSYSSPYWLTYKEAVRLGGHIRKGEHATPIIFSKWIDRQVEKDDGTLTEKHFPFLRYYNVFNAEQTEGCRLALGFSSRGRGQAVQSDRGMRSRLRQHAEPAELHHGATESILRGRRPEAYYSPSMDRVVMPRPDAFDSLEFYYSVLFHELTHSTGSKSRLNRETLTQALHFGDTNYSREELVAEMGASFLAGHSSIEQVTLENSAAYLASWIRTLKGEPRLVIIAAANAQKAVDYMLNRKPETETPAE
jgi:antirestriction protein ArdC